jgi:hypothetical protein
MEPPMLVRRLVACAALTALAGSASAQMPNMMGQMDPRGPMSATVHVDPNGFIDRPDAPDCRDGKPRAGPSPRVVRVMPAPGSVVRPGPMVLSVTFDRPMACKANLAASPFPLPCPDGQGAVIISPDRRTLTTVCPVEAGSSYTMPLVDFVGDGGSKSERYDLAFTTSTEAPVKDARQAMSLERTGVARR